MNESRTSLHNPLILGQPYGSSTSLSSPDGGYNGSTTRLAGVSTAHLPPVEEPSEALAQSNSETSSPDREISMQTALAGGSMERSPSRAGPTSHTETSGGSTIPPRATIPLHHTRTAPTTVPIAPVAFAGSQTMPHQSKEHLHNQHSNSEESDRSSSATLNGLSGGFEGGVPPAAGGLHGNPLPGSQMESMSKGDFPKDHQASSVGGTTGPGLAALARKDLHLDEKHAHGTDSPRHSIAESRDQLGSLPPPVDPARKIERTATGTHVTGHSTTANGNEKVSGYGMVPVTRQTSLPPAVGLFGGVAPSGPDAEMGLRAVRSHEEELERQAEMEQKGPNPWSVRFEPGEKANPKNWGVVYRWFLTGLAGLLVLNSTFASSAPAGILTDLIVQFNISQEVAILTLSLFVAGYCVGPLLWGPLSEVYGRRPLFILSFLVYTGFQVGCALSPNTGAILVFRMLSGIFASAPLTNSGAVIADIWDVDHRGQAMSIFALAPFAGPSVGPIVSGFISVTGNDWRWVFWILAIFAGVCLVVVIFLVPETYAPMLLVQKAKRLRKETGDDRWFAPLEKADTHWKTRVRDILFKPFLMLVQEPMLLAITLYMSFVYGVVYLLFEAFPFVFVQVYGFNQGENGLAFLGFFMGGFVCVVFFMTIIEPRYQRHAAHMAPQMPKPEKRLELCVISGWALVVAMFWFGWTAYPNVHWMSAIFAAGLIGVGVLGMFVSLFNYAIDVYLWAAASALAIMTVMRSIFGAGFPLFAGQMYEKLGVHWASSLLGFLALLMAPIPMVLMKFGPALRKRSKFSPNKMD